MLIYRLRKDHYDETRTGKRAWRETVERETGYKGANVNHCYSRGWLLCHLQETNKEAFDKALDMPWDKLLPINRLFKSSPDHVAPFLERHNYLADFKRSDITPAIDKYIKANNLEINTKGGRKPKKKTKSEPQPGVLKQLNATVLLLPSNASDIAELYGDESVKKELVEERRIKCEHAIKAGLLLLDIGINLGEVEGLPWGDELANILELMATASRKLMAAKRGFNKIGG